MDDRGNWLGFDLGTQSVRALVVSADGEVLAAASRPLVSARNGSRHEQNPEQWWDALTVTGRESLASLPPKSSGKIGALAICGTSGTILLVDAAGDPRTSAIMYDDSRASEDAARANEVGGAAWEALGYQMQPTWALPKLLWLLREHGNAVRRCRLAQQVDFVIRRLIGRETPSDSSHALKSGYDLLSNAWPHEVMSALGVPERMLPGVVPPGTELGIVGHAGAEATGIPEGTPVIAGMTDGCAAQLAAGALRVGGWNSVLGTTLALKGVSRERIRDPQGVVYSHRSPDGHWLPGGASSVGAGVLSERFAGRDLRALDRRAAEREPANALAYPLVSRGERFPFIAPEAQAFMLGSPADEASEFAALLQGVAYIERLCFDHLDQIGAPTGGELSFTGGATRSRYWCQLRADVLGREVRLVEHAEPALGMAVLAAAGARRLSETVAAGKQEQEGSETGDTGMLVLSDTAAEMVRVREVIEPRSDPSQRFREPYVRLVDELERRGWLHRGLAEHARARAAR
ncbi:MAG: FGGY-family carbohydrate kinase [Solirubrobacteraceae bacterium]